MGELIITFMGETKKYLINTQVCEEALDSSLDNILKHYPQDAHVEFNELY